MRDSDEFRRSVRRGAKGTASTVVVHVVPGTDGVTSVGFVVSKAVGNAVTRNQVKRRLRHLMRDRLTWVPSGSRVVVRALPAAATASSGELTEDLDAAMRRAARRPSERLSGSPA